MKRLSTSILLSLCSLLPAAGVHASSPGAEYQFDRLDNMRGLSGNEILSILRDSRGFMWFGTASGLNRYDGNTVRIYRSGERGIPGNNISRMGEDADGNLWIPGYTADSYAMYDWRTDLFHSDTDSLMRARGLPARPGLLRFDRRGNMYACYGPGGGIYRRTGDGRVTHYPQGDSLGVLSRGRIVSLAFGEENVWVMNSRGTLECLDTRSGSVVMRDGFFNDRLQNSTIDKSLFLDSDGDVWVYPGVRDTGAALFDPRSGTWRFFDMNTSPALSSGLVRVVRQDLRGLIWIGTDHGGINVFDKKSGTMTVLRHDPSNPRSVGQNTIISLWCDPSDGTVWAGTYKNGVSVYHPDMFKFSPGRAFQAAAVVDCNAFCRDRQGNIWIGTNGDGLIRYNEATGARRIFTNDPADPSSISSNTITALTEDAEGVIWIGTYFGGMCSWDGRRFTRYLMDENNPNTLSSRSVYGIGEDEAGNLWIGTLGGGVDRLDPARRTFTHHTTANTPGLGSNFVISVSDLFDGNIYLCTAAGLSVIDTASGEISPGPADTGAVSRRRYGAPNYAIRDSRGWVWIATDNHIEAYDPSKGMTVRLTPGDGLPASEFVSLVEDGAGDIWAGTRAGLVRISGGVEEGFRITCYYAEDGLPGQVFNLNAVYRGDDGRLCFGTTRGYTVFDPLKIVSNTSEPALRLTGLAVNGRRVEPDPGGGKRAILHRSIDDTREITLRPGQTGVEFRFSAMNFINPEKATYRYRLEGLDREWKTTVGDGVAAWSNLNAGTYTLWVEAGTGDGVWSSRPVKMMEIDVKAPLWLSWWAIVLYAMVGLVFVRLLVERQLDKQRKHYLEAQRMLEMDKKHEVDEMKLRFFTNVSHEFKTPVTLILTPLEQLLRSEESPEKRSLMEIMHRNARALLGMVNEILDLRKLEMDKMVFRPVPGEIIGFIKDICQSFSTLSDERSIRLTFTTWIEELHLDFDTDKMTKILTNLLANAFQYTVEGSVDVSVSISEAIGTGGERRLCIRVADTGIGIAADHIDRIFDRFYRVGDGAASAGSGTGIGLHMVSEFSRMHGGSVSVESSPGQGSVFTVSVPICNASGFVSRGSELISSGANTPPASPQNGGEGGGSGKPLLLVVDDNDDFREFVSGLMEGSYKVITAADGREAWDKVLEDLPDLILADVMMPGTDGLEFCRMVKGDIRTSHIPVVLLTARSSDESRYQGIEAGADDYISKPFDIDMLMLRISKIIERQKVLYDRFRGRIDISPGEIEVTTMDEKFVRRAVAIVEENIDQPDFLVEDLCRSLGISRVYFYKKILALTDKTPSEFIRFIRLKRAADLLEKSQLFVGEVAYKVGFNDPKYFRGYFKKEFGVTPSEYKKRFEE